MVLYITSASERQSSTYPFKNNFLQKENGKQYIMA